MIIATYLRRCTGSGFRGFFPVCAAVQPLNYDREKVQAAFAQLDMPLEIRPDKVGVEDFVKLMEWIFA